MTFLFPHSSKMNGQFPKWKVLFEISCWRRQTQPRKNKNKRKKEKAIPQQEPLKSKTTPSWAKKED